jgi:hypothetical protein
LIAGRFGKGPAARQQQEIRQKRTMKNPIPILTMLAAMSVVAFCTIGIAGMTGLFPLTNSESIHVALDRITSTRASEAPKPVNLTFSSTRALPAAGGKPIEFKHGGKVRVHTRTCDECGVVESIVRRERRIGTVDPSVGATGALIIGMAYANSPGIDQFHEKTVRYIVTVRMDDGSYRTIQESAQPPLRQGIRVRLEEGGWTLIR